LPIPWEQFDDTFQMIKEADDYRRLEDVKQKIIDRTPDYLECQAKICELDKICSLEEYIEQDVFAQAVAITATLEEYAPRQLKLFCWSS